ncbi:hypothetical protein ACFP7A_08225 [Sporolactobacillus kofuensis]|uniref:Uncharacterized protein n=1 Tax=Sporolactobacillus kofuensis TaxID=269672 RepID=A0ABW1WHL8_9BACL|nr:hypothetical protein [Sporolactobacillus kofuensis]MCO7176718.1 hypothetical protein [Sporolactobacillus kofuensis]
MQKIHTEIGDCLFEVQADSATLMTMFTRNFICVSNVQDQSANMIIYIHGGYDTPIVKKGSKHTHEQCSLMIQQNDYVIIVEKHFSSAHLYVYHLQALITAFYNLYSLLIVHNEWGIMVNCRYMIKQGEAHLELTRLANNAHEISTCAEDKVGTVLIKISPNGATLFECTAQNIESAEFYPIGSIRFSNQFSPKKIRKTQVMLQLLDSVPYLPNENESMLHMISMLKQFVAVTPILGCSTDRKFIS